MTKRNLLGTWLLFIHTYLSMKKNEGDVVESWGLKALWGDMTVLIEMSMVTEYK